MIAKKHLSIIAFLFFITLIVFQLFIPLFSFAAEDENEASYTLVWADEFNMDGRPNPNNWVFETGFVRNLEEQWYQPENAWCENGMLMIESRRERVPNPNYDPDSKRWNQNREYAEYSSASIKTKGLHSWTYGRIEMRGRFDTRMGMWPAFWTLGSAREWPGAVK